MQFADAITAKEKWKMTLSVKHKEHCRHAGKENHANGDSCIKVVKMLSKNSSAFFNQRQM